MLERDVESKLKWLEGFGFKVLKLRTPGTNGVMDRLILQPTWSPGPPMFVEIKRPGKTERALQAERRDNWRARGCIVLDMCDTTEKVHKLCYALIRAAVNRYLTRFAPGTAPMLPDHILDAYETAKSFYNA